MKPIAEIVFPDPMPVTGEVPDLKAEDIVAPLSIFDEMTDDEIQYWSTPYYDELQAQKEAKRQQLEQDALLRDER